MWKLLNNTYQDSKDKSDTTKLFCFVYVFLDLSIQFACCYKENIMKSLLLHM